MNPLNNLLKMILSNPWTTLLGVVSLGVLAIYSKTLTLPQLLNFILTAVVGFLAKDGHKGEAE